MVILNFKRRMEKQESIAVTGSSTGIGFETLLLLARSRFYTYATMRDTNKRQLEFILAGFILCMFASADALTYSLMRAER